MSNFNFGTHGYTGEVLEDLLTYTAHGNDTYKHGLIHVKSGIQYQYRLPAVKMGDIIQDNVPTPQSTHGAAQDNGFNKYTFSERMLEPQNFMVYLEFNPRDFEQYYKFAQPDGNLVFRTLDPRIQATMLRLLIDRKDQYLNDAIWLGAKGGNAKAGLVGPDGAPLLGGATAGGPMKYFDGAIKRIMDNVLSDDADEINGGQCILTGNTEFTDGESVEKALYAMWAKCPVHIRGNQDLVYLMNWGDWDMYDQYLTAKTVKYTGNEDMNKLRFKGKRVLPIVGIPPHTIIMGVFSSSEKSNLWMGVDFANDETVLKIDRLQANSELYFFQMRLKMDVNIVRPGEILVHTAYKKQTP